MNPLRATKTHLLWLCLFLLSGTLARADVPEPGPGTNLWLNKWTFYNTNTWESDLHYTPISSTNVDSTFLGNGTAVVIDNTNGAALHYRIYETNRTNLTVDIGSVMFWFAPSWSSTNQSGTGPGQWGRLFEAGEYTTNASIGLWSIFVDPEGENIYFSGQDDQGNEAQFLTAPITWTTNYWHLIALTCSESNSVLYVDGEVAAIGEPPYDLPPPVTLTNGFYLGSDLTGLLQARGMFDDLVTYDFPITEEEIYNTFQAQSFYYYLNPANEANYAISSSAPPIATYDPGFNPITGIGSLQYVSFASNCVVRSNVWITNMVAEVVGPSTNRTINFTFEIAGGSNTFPYDVFATAALIGTNLTNGAWAWMGQGYTCSRYILTNLSALSPTNKTFIILGCPVDTDADGLTDAYEKLISHSDPLVADSNHDGLIDGVAVLYGMNPNETTPSSSNLLNYSYDPGGWLKVVSGGHMETIGFDFEGNILQLAP